MIRFASFHKFALLSINNASEEAVLEKDGPFAIIILVTF